FDLSDAFGNAIKAGRRIIAPAADDRPDMFAAFGLAMVDRQIAPNAGPAIAGMSAPVGALGIPGGTDAGCILVGKGIGIEAVHIGKRDAVETGDGGGLPGDAGQDIDGLGVGVDVEYIAIKYGGAIIDGAHDHLGPEIAEDIVRDVARLQVAQM